MIRRKGDLLNQNFRWLATWIPDYRNDDSIKNHYKRPIIKE